MMCVKGLGQNDSITNTINVFSGDNIFLIGKNNDKEKNEKVEEASACQIMYLNAVNFNFDNNKSGYAGHLNFFYTSHDAGKRFGFNAGLMKINYSNNDSLYTNRLTYVKINPLDELTPGNKYLRQFNEYKRKSTNSSYSIYFQPLCRLNKDAVKESGIDVYAHLHAELLITKFETTTTINTIQQDTIAVAAGETAPLNTLDILHKELTLSKTLLNGYLGGGLTFNVKLKKDSSIFFQPTFGFTTNYPQPASVNGSGYYRIEGKDSWNGFYLIRSYYRNKLTSGTELIIGTDIRGLLPEYPPYYSVYVGVNTSLDKLAELFK